MAEETYSGVMVALLPAENDPVVAASSEPAHMTLLHLGDSADLSPEDVRAAVLEVEAYAHDLDGPLVMAVETVGPLGEEGATVAHLEKTDSAVALRQGLLDGAHTVSTLAVENDKFVSKWLPHVTLSYPERPAEAEYAAEQVTFDRIAVWVGDEHHDFDMGGAVSDKIEASAAGTAAFDMAGVIADLAPAELVVPEDELPPDELEEDEELITEIPVHGVATMEGSPTGDGRGFRPGALSFGTLPAPLGYEFESSHGGDNSRVSIIGRIDEFWTKETDEPGVFEVRWRGVIMPAKPYAAQAIESIIDGSYTGVSVIVDEVTVDVTEQREAMRKRILAERQAGGTGHPDGDDGVAVEAEEMDIEEMLDLFVGDGTMAITWFEAAQIRRFDMVPTGAFMQGYTALGAEFADEMTVDELEASAAALADCGCADSEEEARAIVAAATGFAPGTKDGPGWITHPIPTSRIRRYWVRGKGAAKIKWGVPGDFNRCRAQLAKYVQNPEWLAGLCANMHKEAIGVWPGQEGGGGKHSLLASAVAAPLYSLVAAPAPVDAALFQNPNLEGKVGLSIDGERVYGYVALWNVCHIGDPEGPGSCTLAPRSATNYAHFRTGTVMTTEGPIAVGSITMSTGHAGGRLSAAAAAAHYDNTGAVIADVACGEDAYGIWFSGRKRPGVTDEDVYAAMASGRVSGDWRRIGGNFELVGALVVNVAGYPIPNPSLVASGEMSTAIIGEGIFDPEAIVASADASTDQADIADIAVRAAEAYMLNREREQLAAKAAPARAALRRHALSTARRRLAERNLAKESR